MAQRVLSTNPEIFWKHTGPARGGVRVAEGKALRGLGSIKWGSCSAKTTTFPAAWRGERMEIDGVGQVLVRSGDATFNYSWL